MASSKCAGCIGDVEEDEAMHCMSCYDFYHYDCLNIPKKTFRSFSVAHKSKWVCPTCRSKEPKTNNTNTPVRSNTTITTANASVHENVTLRSKPISSINCTCISPDIIREIIRDELRSALDNQLLEIKNQVSVFEQSLQFLSNEYDSMKKEFESQKSNLITLQKENDLLRSTTRDMAQRLSMMDQQSRAKNIEINCVPEHRNENILSLVQQLGKIINCPVKVEDIFYCSRVAKMNSSSTRPRSVLVSFSSPRLRDTFLASSITFNKKNPTDKLNTSHLGIAAEKALPIYVVENLTAENKSLHAAARIKAKELSYKYVWVRNGRIFMRKSDNAKFVLVKDTLTLQNLS